MHFHRDLLGESGVESERLTRVPRLKLNLVGERLAGEAASEAGHLIACPACGQAIDKRDLGAVLHHAQPGHAPLPTEDAGRLAAASRQLDRTLKEQP
jgi:hypothetical protein